MLSEETQLAWLLLRRASVGNWRGQIATVATVVAALAAIEALAVCCPQPTGTNADG